MNRNMSTGRVETGNVELPDLKILGELLVRAEISEREIRRARQTLHLLEELSCG